METGTMTQQAQFYVTKFQKSGSTGSTFTATQLKTATKTFVGQYTFQATQVQVSHCTLMPWTYPYTTVMTLKGGQQVTFYSAQYPF